MDRIIRAALWVPKGDIRRFTRGYLIKNTLRAATLCPGEIYGLWNIGDLRIQPPVEHALVMDPAIEYFMEEDNRLFYGVKRAELYVYDDEYDDIECLGPIEPAIQTVFDEAAEIYIDEEL